MSLPVVIENLKTHLVGVQAILPAHVSYERFVQCAAVAIANNKDLMAADSQSVVNALTLCARDGLVADNREAALVVFSTKQGNDWIKKAQYMPMVDGVMKRARQSGEISIIASRAIYKGDTFRAWMDDLGEHVLYEPTLGERGDFVGVFAYAKMKSGEVQFEFMNLSDIEKVRKASKGADKGPWVDWFESMAKKSCMHRLCRRLPNSAELMEMLERGNQMNWQPDDAGEIEVNQKPAAKSIKSLQQSAPAAVPEFDAAPADMSKAISLSFDCQTESDLGQWWQQNCQYAEGTEEHKTLSMAYFERLNEIKQNGAM